MNALKVPEQKRNNYRSNRRKLTIGRPKSSNKSFSHALEKNIQISGKFIIHVCCSFTHYSKEMSPTYLPNKGTVKIRYTYNETPFSSKEKWKHNTPMKMNGLRMHVQPGHTLSERGNHTFSLPCGKPTCTWVQDTCRVGSRGYQMRRKNWCGYQTFHKRGCEALFLVWAMSWDVCTCVYVCVCARVYVWWTST